MGPLYTDKSKGAEVMNTGGSSEEGSKDKVAIPPAQAKKRQLVITSMSITIVPNSIV